MVLVTLYTVLHSNCAKQVTDICFCFNSIDLPNDMAWGSKKKMYYDSDYTTKSMWQTGHAL